MVTVWKLLVVDGGILVLALAHQVGESTLGGMAVPVGASGHLGAQFCQQLAASFMARKALEHRPETHRILISFVPARRLHFLGIPL